MTCKIVESWAPSLNGTRTIHVYTNAPLVRLSINGVQFGALQNIVTFGTAAIFYNVPFATGKLEADALSADGVTVLAMDSAASWSSPAAIVLSIDAPTQATGTGNALYLDGVDAAFVRATVVDASGNVCENASSTVITFSISSGPAVVWAVANGDPSDASLDRTSHVSYNGLVRVVLRVTLDATGDADSRALRSLINCDAGLGNDSSTIWQGASPPPYDHFFVVATSPGMPTVTISVPVSIDPRESVLNVAVANVGRADVG